MNISFQGFKITGNSILITIGYVLLILWILKLQECSPSPQTASIKGKDSATFTLDTTTKHSVPQKPKVEPLTKLTILHDTLYKPKPYYIKEKLTPELIDSILKAYSVPYLYTQSFTSPDYKAHFSGVISYDSLYNTKLDVQVLRPIEITNNTTVTNPIRNMVFVGLGIGGGINSFNLSPTLALLTKKQHLYTLSSNVAISEPNVLFTMGFKVHL